MTERKKHPYHYGFQIKGSSRNVMPDVKLSDEEISEAKEKGVVVPTAGLPDFEAIKDVFGIHTGDLAEDDVTRRPYLGKSRGPRRRIGTSIDYFGEHDRQ